MLQNALIRLKLSLSTKISGHWPADDSRWWWLSRWQWWRSAVHCLVEVCCCCTPLLLCWNSAAAALSALHTFHHAQTKPQLIPSPIRVMVWKPSCLHIKWHTWQRSSSPFHVSLLADFDTKSLWLQTIFGWIIIRLCVKHLHWLRQWHAMFALKNSEWTSGVTENLKLKQKWLKRLLPHLTSCFWSLIHDPLLFFGNVLRPAPITFSTSSCLQKWSWVVPSGY